MPDTDRFVNPYNFIPLPQQVVRQKPVGHDQVTDTNGEPLFYGHIDVEWTLRTPLLLPETAEAEGWVRKDGTSWTIRIPGSAMKGALRSLHETMFAGCLRVVDEEFVPGYRDAAVSEPDSPTNPWSLAAVSRSRAGTPLEVIACDQTEWVDALSLLAAYRRYADGSMPKSGDVFQLAGTPDESSLGRWEIRSVDKVESVQRLRICDGADDLKEVREFDMSQRVVAVTSTSARKIDSYGRRASCFWATAELTEQRLKVTGGAAKQFRRACDGSEDRRLLLSRKAPQQPSEDWRTKSVYSLVKWWPSRDGGYQREDFKNGAVTVGRRAQATGLLHAGDVVWIKRGTDHAGATVVTEIKLSQLWRHTGRYPTKDRIPTSLLPCKHPYESADIEAETEEVGLCLSCAIFGSADVTGEHGGEGRQDAYASRIRVGSARSNGAVTLETVSYLAPMGAPHPGAGMFYLNNSAAPPGRPQGDLPSNWGSHADSPRGLRGRKFYWHSEPDAQAAHWTAKNGRPMQPRYKAQTTQQEGRARKAQLLRLRAGQVLTQRLAINGLDDLAVRTLLAALEPARVLNIVTGAPERIFAVHLGGGKPLGLGTAIVTIKNVDLQSARVRYGRTPAGSPSCWEGGMAVAERGQLTVRHREALVKRVGRYSQHLGRLARMLDMEGLDDYVNHVSYPPAISWSDVGRQRFGESYRFFGRYDGEQLAEDAHGWQPLPTLPQNLDDRFDPTLPVANADPDRL